MASVSVLRMADDMGHSAPSVGQAVHPFFKPKSVALSVSEQVPCDQPKADTIPKPLIVGDNSKHDEKEEETKPGKPVSKRRKRTKAEAGPADKDCAKPPPKKRTKPDPEALNDTPKPAPKKRSKAVPPAGNIAKHFAPLHAHDASSTTTKLEDAVKPEKSRSPELSGEKEHSTLSQTNSSALNTEPAAKPVKVMKFNPKTGTIGSPPKPMPAKVDDQDTDAADGPASTGRALRSKLVRVEYGKDDTSRMRIGNKLDSVLSSPPKAKPSATPGKKKAGIVQDASPRIKKSPPKITHPFFGGKGKLAKTSTEPQSTAVHGTHTKGHTLQSSTPVSPAKRGRPPLNNGNTGTLAKFSIRSLGLKIPGAKEPAWPWKGMVHVRGDMPLIPETPHSLPSMHMHSRKSKGHAVGMSSQDSMIYKITQEMDILSMADSVRNIDNDNFTPPPPELRLPQKHFESGRKLQSRILPELRRSVPAAVYEAVKGSRKLAGRKEMTIDQNGIAAHPPQLLRLFNSVGTSLSAFDRAACENTSWAQKYAPVCAAEVIQPGREAFFLREWLQALVVQSVDTGSGAMDGEKDTGKDKKTGKDNKTGAGPSKKAKKRKKLDDFIVSSDEEGNGLDVVSDGEFDCTPSGKFGILKKTVIRTGDTKGKRLANTIVISGPHGCGKTAAVYAVAKELDFEVFEINSSTRRSGKDVDERIGDMLKHHHVSHQNARPKQKKEMAEEDPARISEDEVAKDIKAGKQKTMQSFFTKKALITTAPAKPIKPLKPAKPVKPAAAVTLVPKQSETEKTEPSKGQKQSLILLDEVDILYDEDKQFWPKVIELIVKSKRPFIMTCNDETLVPLQNLHLHGIFRFSAPPTDLAVDRLLLVAANEGHALRRDAVEALYESRNCDLRAATMDLNYWCQIGVGDRRGGFDWFYPRWPKGVDLDENMEVVRVVSEDTYQLGMGWLGHDVVADQPAAVEDELMQQSWGFWSLDAGQQVSSDCSAWADALQKVASERQGRLAALEMFDRFSDAVSAADICSSRAFGLDKEGQFDITTSDLSAKAYDDYVLGLPVLDTPPLIRNDTLPTLLPMTMRTLARSALELSTSVLLPGYKPALHTLDEDKTIGMLQHSFTTPAVDSKVVARIDFAMAFDAIAAPESTSAVSYLEPSVFDRNMEPITLDVAPYVRCIVAYDSALQQQRLRLSNLVSEGGGRGAKGAKRMRTTRAALSAMEGGTRSTTRAEKWFKADLNPHLVMRTGGRTWIEPCEVMSTTVEEQSRSPSTSPEKPKVVKPKAAPRKGKGKKRVIQEDSDDDLASCLM